MTDPNKYLYHYTTAETALEHILVSNELRFSPLIYTNDPRETKDWEFSCNIDGIDKSKELPDIYDLFKEELQKKCKVVCFTRDNPKKFVSGQSKILHRGYSHPRMWAQYANNHKGICLVFDKSKLNEIIFNQVGFLGDIFQGAVSYRDINEDSKAFSLDCSKLLQLGVESFYKYHLKKHLKSLIFEKLQDWSSELEYRWALISSTSSYEYFSIEGAVSGIVLGNDFSQDDIETVLQYTESYMIPVIQLHWRNGYPNPTTLECFSMRA